MTRHLHLDCIGGIAGDMTLAALLDAGADLERLRALPEQLELGSVELAVTRVQRQGVRALHVDVRPPPSPPSRTWRELRGQIERSSLEAAVRERSLAVFGRLAVAEAAVHGSAVDDVHFHELGGIDTLVDICGAVLLLADLGIDRVSCSPLPLTHGIVKGSHGLLPVPAPATIELLRGAQVRGVEGMRERVTPTGAALAVELADTFGPAPALTLERAGYGAGTDDPPDRPNVLRALVGTAVDTPATGRWSCSRRTSTT